MHRKPSLIMKQRKPVRPATTQELDAITHRRREICYEMMENYRSNSLLVSSVAKSPELKKFDLKAFEKDALELYEQFRNEGYFKPTLLWLIGNIVFVLFFLFLCILSMHTLPSWSSFSYIVPGICLGLFWHQSGFSMHDA